MIPAIIFSKDRPLQLAALLDSLAANWLPGGPVYVLAKTSSERYARAYRGLARERPEVAFLYEGDFQAHVERLLLIQRRDSQQLVVFFTDDSILFRAVTSLAVRRLLASNGMLAFSLRLGRNTDWCYPHQSPQTCQVIESGEILSWHWPSATGDFGYPFSLDGHLLRIADVEQLLQGATFAGPNYLEDALASRATSFADRRPVLGSYRDSCLVGIPHNRVQDSHPNRYGGGDADELLRLYGEGLRLNWRKMAWRDVNAAHCEIPFIYKHQEVFA